MMRISSFANNLILINNRLVWDERQCTMKFYRLRFRKREREYLHIAQSSEGLWECFAWEHDVSSSLP